MIDRLHGAWVIGRRDFTAIIFSKAFFFFLLGPLFPVIVGIAAGSVSSGVAEAVARPVLGVALERAEDTQALIAARSALVRRLGEGALPELKPLPAADAARADAVLKDKTRGLAGIITGTLAAPRLTATGGTARQYEGDIALIAGRAAAPDAVALPSVVLREVAASAGSDNQARILTAQLGQSILFLLTMLLAGMVLSNMVEEKANKIIEVLAAAIPVDAIFLGKLFAMLAMALVGIVIWGSVGFAGLAVAGGRMPDLPAPAVGWPLFAALLVIYFAMAYLILGSLFLGVGALASTVREVQTLSMPVTMVQLIIFFFSVHTVTRIGEPVERAAAIFPFSSPFAMVARAAQSPDLLPHLVALIGQALFVALVISVGARLFRRNVLKSGPARRSRRRRGESPESQLTPM